MLQDRNGNKFLGEWDGKNIIHGRGVFIYPNGAIFEGYFLNDLRHDKGRMIWQSGKIHEG